MRKTEIRLFLDRAYVRLIDGMVRRGLGGSRSEVVRMIVQSYFLERGRAARPRAPGVGDAD
jgi:Arc/MetJ-type ribon-helix-helix transcriptional regulator